MALTTATDIQVKCYKNGTQSIPTSGWNDASTDYYWIGKTESYNYVTVIKFTTDSDADAIELSLTNYSTVGAYRNFYYAIFSDENAEYNNATPSTIGEGVIALANYTYTESTHRFFKSLSAGTYYIYLWTAADDSTDTTSIYKPTVSFGTYDDFTDIISHKDYRDGITHNHWRDLGTIFATAGYNSTINNCVAVFRFVLPERAKNITFSACVYETNTSDAATMRYKIVSGSEDESLANADLNTSADGTFTLETTSDYSRFSFTVDKYVPRGVSYLYIWSNKEVGVINSLGLRCNPSSNTYGTQITYEAGSPVVYIDNGGSFDAYEVYIDNGTSWDLYEVYIDNGTSWDSTG